MRTDMGFFDKMFGAKVEMDLPTPDGGTRRTRVSKRWFEEMQKEGRIPPAEEVVTAHILDSTGGLDLSTADSPNDLLSMVEARASAPVYRVEPWTVGEDISQDQYDKFADPTSGDLYVVIVFEEGEPSQHCMKKDLWETTRQALKAL